MINIIDTQTFEYDFFYKHTQPKFGYSLRLEDFIRYHFKYKLVQPKDIVYDQEHFLFFAIFDPIGLEQFDYSHMYNLVADSNRLNICISYPMETFTTTEIETFIDTLLQHYKQAKFYFSNGNVLTLPSTLDSTRIKHIPNPLFELLYNEYIKNNNITYFEKQPLTKKFTIPIRQAKQERIYFYLWLRDNNILPNSYYSWTTEALYQNLNLSKPNSFTRMPILYKPIDYDTVKFLENKVFLDPDDDRPILQKQWEIPQKIYTSSFCQVVVETTIDRGLTKKEKTMFLTEKTYKAMFYKQPFLLLSEPYSLRYLKSLGYKTFDEIFDESYDEIELSYTRINHICKTIKQLNDLSMDQLSILRDKINDVVEYNHYHLLSRPSEKVLINTLKETLLYDQTVNVKFNDQ